MTPEEIEACCERAEAATPGPWIVADGGALLGGCGWVDGPDGLGVARVATDPTRPDRGAGDATFIAHARADVPALLDAMAELTRERDAARAKCDELWAERDHAREQRDAALANAYALRARLADRVPDSWPRGTAP